MTVADDNRKFHFILLIFTQINTKTPLNLQLISLLTYTLAMLHVKNFRSYTHPSSWLLRPELFGATQDHILRHFRPQMNCRLPGDTQKVNFCTQNELLHTH